jgi:hypothetical protein
VRAGPKTLPVPPTFKTRFAFLLNRLISAAVRCEVLRTFVEIKVTEFQNGGKFPEASF